MSYKISYMDMRSLSDTIFESEIEWDKHPGLLSSFYKRLDLKIINIEKTSD